MFGHAPGQSKKELVANLLLKRFGLNNYDVDLLLRENSSSQLISFKKMRYTDSWSLPLSYVQILKNLGIDSDFKTESYVGNSTFQPTLYIYASVEKLYECLSPKKEFALIPPNNSTVSKNKLALAKELLLNLFGVDESNADIYVSDNSQFIHLKNMKYTDSWEQPKRYMQLLKNLGIDSDFKTESYVGTSSWKPTIFIRATVDQIINKLSCKNQTSNDRDTPKFRY